MAGYVHPHHRSLHAPLTMLAVFSIFIATWSLFSTNVEAVNMQADQQCPAGGVVNQPCKDTTNGYTTSGHCTHIQICAADNWPKAPKGCQPGQVVGRDCPYGKNYNPTPPPGPRPIQIATTSFGEPTGSSISATDIFGKAFGTDEVGGYAPAEEQTVVGTTSIAGIQYLITDDNERLEVGAALTPAPPPPPRQLHLGTIYSLGPVNQNTSGGTTGAQPTKGYTGNSFGGAPQGGPGGDTSISAGSSIIGGIMNSIASLFGGNRPADELVIVSAAMPAIIMPDISLYYQSQRLSSPQHLDLNWDSLLGAREDIFEQRPSIASLIHDALSHTGRIGLDLLTADLAAAHEDLSKALIASGSVIQRTGESVSLYIWSVVSRQ